ncbi:MAG: T9SS type A sorting domain-containing protein [Bacteroidota bacterium]
MKKVKYLTILLLFGFVANGQSLKVINTDLVQQGIIGQDIRTVLKIKNVSDQPVFFNISEVNKEIGSSQKSFICINNDCSDKNIANKREKAGSKKIKILPGEVNESVVLVLEAGLVQNLSSVTYQVSNASNPSDYTQIEIQYDVLERPREGLLYSSLNVDLNDVYPNPATEVAYFDYIIKNDSKEAKIIIHNVLGSIAGEYKLNPFEQQLKISVEDFNPGVYFYSLYIDNEGVATKKLVVRK